jgi:hypothetical protein
MKPLILLLFLLCSFMAFGQITITDPNTRMIIKSDDIIKSDYLLIFQLKYVEKTEIKDKKKEWFTFQYSGYSEPINYDPQTKIFYTKTELETFINSNVMDIFGVYEVVRKMEITNENNLYKIKNSNQ